MKLLFDTNVLVDSLNEDRQPFRSQCNELIHVCLGRADIELMAVSSSLKDVYYIMCRRYSDEPQARKAVGALMTIFELLPLMEHNVRKAYHSDEPDFEDGLIRAVAEDNKVDVIVTRDAAAFRGSTIPAMDAIRCLALVS